ncbi:MAG: hypothetical protein II699_02130 [Lachnospiraceae bacterium]|jgi:flagellar basal-body rod modification protein FlgD|nr:hypothetical protein [Lachnospiraceae bacterium]
MSNINPLGTSNQTNITDTSAIENKNALGKDAFLQLLVTQMKYQDPMNPSDSTQYMSQLAQFTSLEEMENLNTNFDKASAQNLVGKYVIMKTQDATGKDDFISGLVDFTTMQNGKPFLSINGSLYNYQDLDSVVDMDYMSNMAASNIPTE